MDYRGDLATQAIAAAEIEYLLALANRYFSSDLARKDVVWTFAGLRPLLADPKDRATSVTRDYVLDLDTSGAPVLSIYGGKLTSCRKLAEDVVDALAPRLGSTARAWTAGQPLPGGDMPRADFDAFFNDLTTRHPGLPRALLHRYARAYGTRAEHIFEPKMARNFSRSNNGLRSSSASSRTRRWNSSRLNSRLRNKFCGAGWVSLFIKPF